MPIISCRKRVAWYKWAQLRESFGLAHVLSQTPIGMLLNKTVKVDDLDNSPEYLNIFTDLEMTEDVKERFAMEPGRVAKVFVDRHTLTHSENCEKSGERLILGGGQVHS